MKLLINPLFLKTALLLFSCGVAFVVALALMRALRRNLSEESSLPEAAASALMIAEIRRQFEARGELSTEMKLKLRDSLVTISAQARQPASSDPDRDRKGGGFAANNRTTEAASSHS